MGLSKGSQGSQNFVWLSTLYLILVGAIIVVINTMTKATSEERFIWLYTYTVHHWRTQDRNRAGADAEATERYCLLGCSPMAGSASLLIELRTSSPEVNTIHYGLSLTHQSLIKKMLYRLAYSPELWMHFLSWSSLLAHDFSMCQSGTDLRSPTLRTPCKRPCHSY